MCGDQLFFHIGRHHAKRLLGRFPTLRDLDGCDVVSLTSHVDPESRVEMVSSGNPRYRAGRHVVMNAVSGHRDGYPTSCPGSALYALLPRIRAAALAIGLPKIWAPTHTPNLHRIAPDAAIPLDRMSAVVNTEKLDLHDGVGAGVRV